MSTLTTRLDLSRLRARLQRAREMLPRIVAAEMKVIAERALEQRYFGGLKTAAVEDRGILHGRLQKLGAVFVPVTLKHVRREQWPDLHPIYDARVRRRQSSYQGRSIFWVDEVKLDALRREMLQNLLKKGLARGTWKIHLRADFGDIRVTVVKQGRSTRSDHRVAAEMTALMQAMFAERASAMLYRALAG